MRRETAIKNFACAGIFTVTVYLTPMLSAALTNAIALEIGFASAINLSLLTALSIWMCCLGLLLIPKAHVNKWLRFGFLILSMVCLADSTLFLWDFGVFNGTQDVFAHHWPKALAEVLFLASTLAVVISLRKIIDVEYVKICILLTIIACIPFATMTRAITKSHQIYKLKESLLFDFSDEKIHCFSTKKNIFVFVIDALQTEIFLQAMKNDPSLSAAFSGFTCFKNNSGTATNTTFAIPAIISGIPYTGEIQEEKYTTGVLLGSTSLPVIMRDHGFDVRIFSQHTIPYQPCIKTWDNIKQAKQDGAVTGWLSLLRLALYKVAPMSIKLALRDEKYFAEIEASLVRCLGLTKSPLADRFDDVGLLAKLANAGTNSFHRPVFRWFHLQGIHAPFTLISEAERTSLKLPEAKLAQVQADRLLKEFAEMLRSFRRIGVYDTSTIAVLGDHGHGDTRKPVMLVKPAGAAQEFSISEAPTSNIDLPATLIADVGIEAPHKGKNVFALDSTTPRERFFYEFFSIDQTSGLPKMVTAQTLIVPQNTPANWITIATYNPALRGREATTEYMGFTHRDKIDPKKVRGKYRQGNAGIEWSDWIEIDVSTPDGNATLVELLYYRFRPEPKRVNIFIDGVLFDEIETAPGAFLRIIVPHKLKKGEKLDKTTLRFAYTPSDPIKDSLLFVDLLSTKLHNSETPLLKPAKTGRNCSMNAVWGADGDFLGKINRLLIVADKAILPATVNMEKSMFSFSVPKSVYQKPFSYYLIDATNGAHGPKVSIDTICP